MLRPVLLAALLLAAPLLAGCTDKLSLNKASLDAPAFDLAPEKGDATTRFHVDAGALAKYNLTWDFGDGTRAYGASADHKYGFTNGQMTITLYVSDGAKQTTATRIAILGNGANRNPSVSLSAEKTWVQTGSTAKFSTYAYDGDADPLTYRWSVKPPGGQDLLVPNAGSSLDYTFPATGAYTVSVRVDDPKGASSTSTQLVWATKSIPATVYDAQYFGNVTGAGDAGVTEKAYGASGGAVNQTVDSAVYEYAIDYTGYTLVFLTWNDTSTVGAQDLDLELRYANNGTTIWTSAHHTASVDPSHPPAVPPSVPPSIVPVGPYEYNMSLQPPGKYQVVVRSYSAAQVAYRVLIHSSLLVSPELVAKQETGA